MGFEQFWCSPLYPLLFTPDNCMHSIDEHEVLNFPDPRADEIWKASVHFHPNVDCKEADQPLLKTYNKAQASLSDPWLQLE